MAKIIINYKRRGGNVLEIKIDKKVKKYLEKKGKDVLRIDVSEAGC